MRNWDAFVRSHLSLPGLTPERETRIVRELAAQLEDFYREALARGSSEAAADAYACRQIRDWDRMAQDVWLADRAHARPRLERWSQRLDEAPPTTRNGVLKMIADLLQDLRFAARQLVKSPGFTLVALLTLALGIGANTAIFSVVNGVLLRPLPYPQPEALVRVHEVVPQYGRFSVAPASFLDWRQQNTVFERIAAYSQGSATFPGDTPERITNATVSWDIFDLLRVAPIMGRGFMAAEDVPGANRVIVLSQGMWQRRFGGDPNILDRAVTLNGTPFTVVGVMPAGFYFPSREVEYWTPVAINPANASRGGHFLGVIARLKPGTSIEQAGAEMRTIAGRLATQYPDSSADESAEVVALHEQVVGGIRRSLLTLLGAVGLVVLIACGNVANLLLVRASVREKEIAIRTALGAGRRRLVLQMLAESLVLALIGGALGLLLAYAAVRPIQTLSAGSIPRVQDIAIDGRVLSFTLVLGLVTGLVFGLVPAWQASRANLNETLKEGGRSSTASGGRWLRNALVMGEVALSLVLLVGASLLLRSFSRLTGVDPGFRAENVLAFRVGLPQMSYRDDPQRAAFFASLLERLRTLPRVTAAGMVQSLPLRGDFVLSVTIQGRPAPPPSQVPSANYRAVSSDYFDAMSIPLRRGRAFTDRDAAAAPMVAVVDEAFVSRHFPGDDPIGRGIDIGNGTDGFYEIVGVVGAVRYEGLDTTAAPTMYVPFSQDVFSNMWMVVRTHGNPTEIAAAARGAVRDLDRGLPAYAMSPLADIVNDSVAQRRFSVLLLSLFALVALFLAAVGLYGVISYTVSLRTQEIGVRLAIGASRGHLLRMVIGQGLKLAIAGVAIGILGALALAQLITKMLFGGVTPFDLVSYAITAAVLLIVTVVACYVPARRAMRVDPLVALRAE